MPKIAFIIGGHRCGTTSLYKYLCGADICCPGNMKEPRQFTDRPTTIANYERLRRTNSGNPWLLDATVSYLTSTNSPSLIHQHYPDAPIIALLRNPTDRLYSAYWQFPLHLTEDFNALKSVANFPEFAACETKSASYWPKECALFQDGMYVYGLRRWIALFPDMLIIKSEDFFANPRKYFDQIANLLNTEPVEIPAFNAWYWASKGVMDPETRTVIDAFYEHYNDLLKDEFGVLWP